MQSLADGNGGNTMYINIYSLILIGLIILAAFFAFTIALVYSRRNLRALSYQLIQLRDNEDLFPREYSRDTGCRPSPDPDYTINITGTQIN